MTGGAREAALSALERCRRDGAWPDAVLGSLISGTRMPPKDRALTAALCYGVLQNRTLLDDCLQRFSHRQVAKLDPKVLDILRISAYQLMFLKRISAPAVCNEAVELCKKLGYAYAAGYVNAVLRRISEDPAIPEISGPPLARLSIRYSHPAWLVEYLAERLGLAETEALLAGNNAPAPAALTVNTLKTDAETLCASLRSENVDAEAHPYVPGCLTLKSAGGMLRSTAFREGRFFVQDAAALLAVMAAEPGPRQKILDACAAPGGKSFAAKILSGGAAEVTACDIREKKLKRVREGAERLGLEIKTRAADAREGRAEWNGAFDTVLADVPCSGLGVIRKKPDIRWKQPSEFAGLPAIQGEILNTVADYVRPGGTLLYSTCTFRAEENGEVVSRFLAERPDFAPEDFDTPIPGADSENGCLQLWPQRHGTDGFFIAKLRKQF